ncbi:uncharacterized protein KGF55_001546 [Candida pseudojiufengensis]|uniref:uncharacterized protein n=1 Tax=Candida pseudojiufengensis TaxID=497109 RepID=UPI0022241873|nr:uncharacterized protein KGF55_001546 [Candida pseudojiufengensis]KAI5965325.1 hypothetical protein KGF55_001546 [Candida pseudojiufengensis]
MRSPQLLIVGITTLITTSVHASIIQNQPRNGVIAFDTPLDVSTDLSKRQVGEHDYIFPVSNFPKLTIPIGSNKDVVQLSIDTGSWLTQVPDVASNCTECLLPNGKLGLYDANKSTTAVKTGQTLKSDFAPTHYYHGKGVVDDIWFAPNFKIPGTLFNDVQEISPLWHEGILGLSKPPKGSENQNIVWNAYKAGLISKPIFAITQRNESSNSLQLFLGGHSKSQMTEDYTWTSIENKNFAGHIDFININGAEIKINATVTFDTGNYGVSVSQEVYDAIINSLPYDPLKSRGIISYDSIKDRSVTVSIYGKNYSVPLKAFFGPGCDPGVRYCDIVVYPNPAWNWGSSFNRFLNLALNYDNGSYIGIAGWKPSNTNDVVAF